MPYEIIAKSRYGTEVVDEVDTGRATVDRIDAIRLRNEYRLAYGSEFSVSIKYRAPKKPYYGYTYGADGWYTKSPSYLIDDSSKGYGLPLDAIKKIAWERGPERCSFLYVLPESVTARQNRYYYVRTPEKWQRVTDTEFFREVRRAQTATKAEEVLGAR